MRKLSSLSSEEITFIYAMLLKYGGMPMHVEEEYQPPKHYKQNKQKGKKVQPKRGKSFPVDKTKPSLYNFKDPLWNKCTDEKFLAYREIMERVK